MPLCENPACRVRMRRSVDVAIENVQLRGHNASLVEQLAAANRRIAVLDERLRGTNTLRRIALLSRLTETPMTQEEVYQKLLAWERAGLP